LALSDRGALNRVGRNVEVSNNFPLGVVKVFHWIADFERL
jgi:hypothetical protein